MSAREPERAEDPVAALVDGMLRRRRVVRGRRAAARAIVAAMAVAWLYAIVEFFQGGPAAAILVFGRVALHAGPLAVAFFALRSPRVGPQLFGRVVLFGQIWWTLFLGVPSVPGLLIGGASIAALVLLGSDRLEADDGPFRPIFFRGALVACILLAGSLGLQAWVPDTVDPTTPESKAADVETQGALYRALDALPETYRQAFVLRMLGSCSLEEASSILGVPVSTVSYRTRRAQQKLEIFLEHA